MTRVLGEAKTHAISRVHRTQFSRTEELATRRLRRLALSGAGEASCYRPACQTLFFVFFSTVSRNLHSGGRQQLEKRTSQHSDFEPSQESRPATSWVRAGLPLEGAAGLVNPAFESNHLKAPKSKSFFDWRQPRDGEAATLLRSPEGWDAATTPKRRWLRESQ